MLFDPAKAQFDLPALAVQFRDGQGLELKVVGEKDKAQVFLGVEVVNAPQGRGVATRALGTGEANGLIGAQSRGAIDPTPRAATVARVVLEIGRASCRERVV